MRGTTPTVGKQLGHSRIVSPLNKLVERSVSLAGFLSVVPQSWIRVRNKGGGGPDELSWLVE